jgi:hypothetical protein
VDADWTGVAISALVVLGGLAVNLFVIGRFVGQWGEAMRNTAATLAKVERAAQQIGEAHEVTVGDVRLLDARVKVTEDAASKFWEMRDAFIRMTAAIEIEGKQQRERLDGLARGQSVIERQLANIVSGRGGGLTVISTEDGR